MSSVVLGMLAAAAAAAGASVYLILATFAIAFVIFAITQPRATLLLWIVAAPLANAYATIGLPAGLPDVTFGRVVIGLVTMTLLLRTMLHGRALTFGRVEIAMLAAVAVAMADTVFRSANAGSDFLQGLDQYVAPALFFVAARNLGFRRSDLTRAGIALAAMGVCLAAQGIYQYLTVSPASLEVIDPAQVAVMSEHMIEGRAVGPLGSAVEYGGVVAIAFFGTLLIVMPGTSGLFRMMAAGALVATAAAVGASLTRSVWLGWFLGLLTLAATDRERRPLILASTVAVALIAAAAVLVLPSSSSLVERASALEPVSGRLTMYRVAARMIAKSPLVGYGRGLPTYEAARVEVLALGGTEAEWAPGQFHNAYVSALIDWGVLGLIPNLAWQFLFIAGALALRRHAVPGGSVRRFAEFFLAASVVYIVQSLFVDTPAFMYLPHLYFLLAGLVHGQLDRAYAAGHIDRAAAEPAAVPALRAGVR